MELNLAGRHALVCGASEGIGRAAAEALAGLGADVTVLARREDVLAEVAATLPRPQAGQRHGHLAADSSDSDGLGAAVAALAGERPVHILVNNTAGPPGGSAHEAEPERYLAVFRQHLIANQILLQAVLPGMTAAGWGRIVNVISTSVKEPIANLGVSNTIRGAVANWAKTLAGELGPRGITVNNVLPGYTRTRRLEQILADRAAATGKTVADVAAAMLATVPAGRFADPAEVAAAIAFLASPAAAYVNGINLPVDGGRTRSL
ncbi:MAG TPA: SDR family oxidoreductase [Arenimonas sp.]|nr:SDR family oxidoreductase [Arenimonas sp.]